jgi:hypothetical protein
MFIYLIWFVLVGCLIVAAPVVGVLTLAAGLAILLRGRAHECPHHRHRDDQHRHRASRGADAGRVDGHVAASPVLNRNEVITAMTLAEIYARMITGPRWLAARAPADT